MSDPTQPDAGTAPTPDIIVLDDRLQFFNAGQQCDVLIGPCACGATHQTADIQDRFAKLYQAQQQALEIYIAKLDVTQQEHDSDLARLKEAEAENEASNDFMAYMTNALSHFPCCCEPGSHKSTPPMMWPEYIGCIVKRAVRELETIHNEIIDAMETRGYFHSGNGESIGAALDDLSAENAALRKDKETLLQLLRQLQTAAHDMLLGVGIHNDLNKDAAARRNDIEGPVVDALKQTEYAARQAFDAALASQPKAETQAITAASKFQTCSVCGKIIYNIEDYQSDPENGVYHIRCMKVNKDVMEQFAETRARMKQERETPPVVPSDSAAKCKHNNSVPTSQTARRCLDCGYMWED